MSKETTLQKLLDDEVCKRGKPQELSIDRPDPLMIARLHKDEYFILTCALFSYGNAKAIVSFLSDLDATWIDMDEDYIEKALEGHYYRFQSNEDVVQWFKTVKRMKKYGPLYDIFFNAYVQNKSLIDGLNALIKAIYEANNYRSKGYEFLIGKPVLKISTASAMKRWMMFFRWMVRDQENDLGHWKCIPTEDLIMPLDVHTSRVSRKLGLLNRKQTDLRAAIELTEQLKQFDPKDPLKYDFALYRIGQENQMQHLILK